MANDPRAGTPAQPSDLVDVDALLAAYRDRRPDPHEPAQRVSFGTSGHRGGSLRDSFNDDHIAATTQAICEYRRDHGVAGPLFIGRDTHALSEPALRTALEVLVANDVAVLADADDAFTPTPAVSHAILTHNRGRRDGLADGIVVTPSHNPPDDGGFKYNPTHGGPAGTEATSWIARRANELLEADLAGVARRSITGSTVGRYDFRGHYVEDLGAVVDLDAVREAGLRIAADPLGGASVAYWGAIADRHRLDLTVLNDQVDPQFGFMTLDHDGRIRMDCSSPSVMASVVARMSGPDTGSAGAGFVVATGNDADADRHGIVTADGLMNPNHFLAVAIAHLFAHRADWPAQAGVGKTAVSSSLIDRVAADLGRRLVETPVGFKWFVPGLLDGSVGFGGEESAGASFLRRDGRVWTTDKDGIILALLAAEITAVTGSTPSERYRELTARFGESSYARIDVPTTAADKAKLGRLAAGDVTATELAGDPITDRLTEAPGNGESLGGLKVVTEGGWFAARPSGTEDVYKVYAESLRSAEHLARIQTEAQEVVAAALAR